MRCPNVVAYPNIIYIYLLSIVCIYIYKQCDLLLLSCDWNLRFYFYTKDAIYLHQWHLWYTSIGYMWPESKYVWGRMNDFSLLVSYITDSGFAPSQWETALLCNDVAHWLVASLRIRADSRFAPSQWETALLCDNVAHWLGASQESALWFPSKHMVMGLYSETQQGLILLTNLHWRFRSWSKKTFFEGQIFIMLLVQNFARHGSCSMMACAKICSNLITKIWTIDTFVCIRF